MLITFGACDDSKSDNVNDDDDDTSLPTYPSQHVCTPSEFIHFAAVAADATHNGNIEYWHCNECNKNYADASGSKLIDGNNPVLLAKNYSVPQNILDKANDVLPFIDETETTTRGAGKTAAKVIIKIVEKCAELGFRIDTESSFAEEKSEMQELMEQIAIIEESLDDITDKANEIMSLLQNAAYQEEVAETNNMLKEMCTRSLETLKNINKVFQDNEEFTEEVSDKVKFYADKWYNYSYGGDKYETLTRRLLDDFQGKYIAGSMESLPYPLILKKCTKSYRIWEDDTYADRMQYMRAYEVTSGLCMVMLNYYRSNCMPDGDELNRQNDSNDYVKMQNMITADSTTMAKAFNSYRAFKDPSKDEGKQITYLQINPVVYNFSDFLEEVKTDDDFVFVYTSLSKMKNCLNKFLDKYNLRDLTTYISTEDIDYVFNSTPKTPLDSIFRKHYMYPETDVPIFGAYDPTINGHADDYISQVDKEMDDVGYYKGQYGFIRWYGEWKNHRAGGIYDHYATDKNNTIEDGCGRYIRYGMFYNHTARDNESNGKLYSMYDIYEESTGPLSPIMAREVRWNYTWHNGDYCNVGNCNRAWIRTDAEGKYPVCRQQTFMIYTGEKYDD